jgi:hypothetical protein
MMVLLIRLAVLLAISTMIPVHGQEVNTLLTGSENEDEVFHIEDELNQRSLQRVTTPPVCVELLGKLECGVSHFFDFQNSAQVALTCTTDAGDDFRSASSCLCTAQVTNFVILPFSLKTKSCSCSVCPSGFGASPFSIDCSDTKDIGAGANNVIPGCKSVDCNGFSCDGTCAREDVCDSTNSCPLCPDEDENTGCGGSFFNLFCKG